MEETGASTIFADPNTPIGSTQAKAGSVVVQRDALTLDLDDEEFIRVANKMVSGSKSFFEKKYRLSERRTEMETYLFGRQLVGKIFKKYESPYVDNIIYESEAYLKPMALSRMPDLIVKAGQNTPEAMQTAEDVTSVVDTDIKSRERRRVLGLAFKQMPVGLIASIKWFWNPEKGKSGDYDFRVVHYENLTLDHTAASNDEKDMQFIAEDIEYSVKEWCMRFPNKEKEFYKKLHDAGIFNSDVNEYNDAGMNTKVKGTEIWFTWYEKHENGEYERIEGVGWYYKELVLGKMKNPNWDWEGIPQTFKFDPVTKKKYAPTEQELMGSVLNMSDPGYSGRDDVVLQTETVFHNHLDNPQKPYIFLGYDQWGKTPIDETSRIEQNIWKQKTVDTRGTQVNEMLNRARGKHIFSAGEGLKAEDIQEMDLNDPEEDVLVKGKVNEVHAFIPAEQPSAQMIQNLQSTTERIFSTAGVNGAVRGNVESDTATTNQIAREGDFTRVDDLTDDTINYACEKMANAILQLIKLRYTEDHYVKVLGDDGKVAFKKINRDMIQDGMEVTITASGTDKLKAEQRAMDMAKLKLIDPLTFYKDMGMSDPKGRAEKLLLFTLSPELYMQQFVKDKTGAAGLAGALDEQTAANGGTGEDGGTQQAQQDIMQMQQGVVPPLPSMVTPGYMQEFNAFVEDPNGLEAIIAQFPQNRDQLLAFSEEISRMAQAAGQQGGTPSNGQPPSQPAPAASANVGPVGQSGANPSPMNTNKVPITPPM